jgi:glycosyltransferase involved in cell wall biosynthesis
MRLLFFGTYDASAHPRVKVLRDGLAAHGATVIECNVPLGLSTASRVAMLSKPWRLPLLGVRLVRCWATLVVRSGRFRRGGDRTRGSWPDAVVVGYLGHFDVLLARRLFPHVPLVLDHLIGASDTATDRGVGDGVRQRLLARLDAAALSRADLVVVDTEEHRDALPVEHRGRALVVPVGAPDEWFVSGPVRAADGPLRAVFFGLFTPLQGAPVIGAALARLAAAGWPAVEVTMVGRGQELERTHALAGVHPGVRWLDWVEPADLPALVADHDVCLGIFGTGAKALRVVPNKVFQGAAAGCALVTSDTAPQRRVLGSIDEGGAAVLVPPGDDKALADALHGLATDRGRLATARAAAAELARRSFTPDAVTAGLYARLLATLPAEPPRVDVPRRPS